MRLLSGSVLVLASALALTGCVAVNGSGAPEITTEPADGATISGDTYSYVVPEGWDEPAAEILEAATAQGLDTVAADLTDADGFSDNVNVVVNPDGEVNLDDVDTLGVDELEKVGATDVETLGRVRVADTEAAHVRGTMSSQGLEYLVEQYILTHDDQSYFVSFSFSTDVPEADRVETAESVLATWEWA